MVSPRTLGTTAPQPRKIFAASSRNTPVKKILFAAAAIGDDKPSIERIYGDSYLDITDLNQLPVKLTTLVKRHIRV